MALIFFHIIETDQAGISPWRKQTVLPVRDADKATLSVTCNHVLFYKNENTKQYSDTNLVVFVLESCVFVLEAAHITD